MEYSASAMKYSLWFVETRETARMFQERSAEDVRSRNRKMQGYFCDNKCGFYECV